MSRISKREGDKTTVKIPKAEKTKEELIEIRKQMMKRNRSGPPKSLINKRSLPQEVQNSKDKSQMDSRLNSEAESNQANSKPKDLPHGVIERLASGK